MSQQTTDMHEINRLIWNLGETKGIIAAKMSQPCGRRADFATWIPRRHRTSSSSTNTERKWLSWCKEGSVGPGMMPARKMFSGRYRISGGRFRQAMYTAPIEWLFPAFLLPNGLNQSTKRLNTRLYEPSG